MGERNDSLGVAKDMKAEALGDSIDRITEDGREAARLTLLPVGSVLMVVRGMILARAFPVAVTTAPLTINQDLRSLTPSSLVEPRFLLRALQRIAPNVFHATGEATHGTRRLESDTLKAWPIPLPPLAEQRRIVAAVEAVLAKANAARDRLNRVPAILKRFRQAVLYAACSGRLTAHWREKHPDTEAATAVLDTIRRERRVQREAKHPNKPHVGPESVDTRDLAELPEAWCWVRADEVVEQGADIRYGIVQPGPNLDDGILYVRGIDIQDGTILVDQLWKTSREMADQYRNSALREGDVLLGIIRHLKVAVVPKSLDGGNMARTTARLRPSRLIASEYLARCLESPLCQSWLKSNYRGGTDMPKVNIEDVVRLPIPVAPLAEQREIVRRVGDLFAVADRIEARLTDTRQVAEQLTQAVLAKAFRGELVPTEAELARREKRTYEPAADLLARIRAEREKATPANGKPTRTRKPRTSKS